MKVDDIMLVECDHKCWCNNMTWQDIKESIMKTCLHEGCHNLLLHNAQIWRMLSEGYGGMRCRLDAWWMWVNDNELK